MNIFVSNVLSFTYNKNDYYNADSTVYNLDTSKQIIYFAHQIFSHTQFFEKNLRRS